MVCSIAPVSSTKDRSAWLCRCQVVADDNGLLWKPVFCILTGQATRRLAKRMDCTVATFYQFANLPDFEAKRTPLKRSVIATRCKARSSLHTKASTAPSPGQKTGWSHCSSSFAATSVLGPKFSARLSGTERITFHRMKVLLRPEIVTLGTPEADPRGGVGKNVEPDDWNA
ncbi:MAG: hypothetical protein Ct9H300mP7_0950 [Verrucomicrobiota bacterium]|nr:MAG: hypothetical protein Ct9H300mP7_0950 [Verrucomicrobiota bacterium]